MPTATVQEFIAYGKAHPGQLSYASFGTGTVSHIYGEVLRQNTGIDLVHVPYKGSSDALKDLLTGRVQLMFDSPSTAAQYAKDGRLKILGSAGEKRRSLMPDTPTLLELGLPGFEIRGWNGLFGPPNMSDAVLQPLYTAVRHRIPHQDLSGSARHIGVRPRRRDTGAVRQGRSTRLRPLGRVHPARQHQAGIERPAQPPSSEGQRRDGNHHHQEFGNDDTLP